MTCSGRLLQRRRVLPMFAGALAGCRRRSTHLIGVVPMGRSHLYWQSIHTGAVAASWDNGVEILWNAPLNETDNNGQIQIVEAMINRRVDAIALAPIDSKVMAGSVARAAGRKIPVIIFDSPVDSDQFVAEISTDNYGGGRMAAERMGRILGGKGKVVIVASQPGSASSVARERGFEEKLRDTYPAIRIADKRFGMADFAVSLKVAENMLTAHPDLNGIFASNETSSVGAAQALKARRKAIRMVGFDWSPTLLQDLKAGTVDALVAQHPFRIGYEAVRLAVRRLSGRPLERYNKLAPRLLTRENLGDPDVQAQINPDLRKYLGSSL